MVDAEGRAEVVEAVMASPATQLYQVSDSFGIEVCKGSSYTLRVQLKFNHD